MSSKDYKMLAYINPEFMKIAKTYNDKIVDEIITNKRYEEDKLIFPDDRIERYLIESGEYNYFMHDYIVGVLKSRSKIFEDFLIGSNDIDKLRFYIISVACVFNFEYDKIKDLFIDFMRINPEHLLGAFHGIKFNNKEDRKEFEDLIHNIPSLAYMYAFRVLKTRWPRAEPHIIKCGKYAVLYAIYVIKDRWPEAEPYINQDDHCWDNYISFLSYKDNEPIMPNIYD